MTALLEYLDLTALLEYIDLLNKYSRGPFQAGKMPQLLPPPPPLWAALLLADLSYSMIVLYSRDHKGVGMAHETTSHYKTSLDCP